MIKDTIQNYKLSILNILAFHYKSSFFTIMNNSKPELQRTRDNPAHIRIIHGATTTSQVNGFGGSSEYAKINSYVYVTGNGFDGNYCTAKAKDVAITLREEVYTSHCDKLLIHGKKLCIISAKELRKLPHTYFKNDRLQTCVTIDVPRNLFTFQNNKEFKYQYKDKDMQQVVDNFKPEYLGHVRYTNQRFTGDKTVYITNEKDELLKELHYSSWKVAAEEITRVFKFVVSANQLQYIIRKGYNRFVVVNNGKERRFYMGEQKSLAQLIKESSICRKAGSRDLIIKVGEKYVTTDETPKTKGWITVDKYEKEWELTYDDFSKQQICVNKPLNPKYPNRKIDGVHKQNYLFECDHIPLKEQVKLINEQLPKEIQDAILWCNYSGGKSLHVVLKTNTPDDATRDERKYLHNWINSVFFGMKADPSGQNANRLARTPNAKRDNGRIQRAFFIRDDVATEYNVLPVLESYRHQKEEMKKHLKRDTSFGDMHVYTLEALKEWNRSKPSKSKQECIDCLEGNLKDWNRTAAVVRMLHNWGWSVEDMLAEGPYNDKWIKTAIKVLQ